MLCSAAGGTDTVLGKPLRLWCMDVSSCTMHLCTEAGRQNLAMVS